MNTSRTRILNNTITDNGRLRGKTFDNSSPRQIAIYLDERAPLNAGSGAVDPRYGYPDPAGVNWELQSVVMYSNVNSGGNVQAMVGVEDYRKNGGAARRWQGMRASTGEATCTPDRRRRRGSGSCPTPA